MHSVLFEQWFSTPIYADYIGPDFSEIQASLFATLSELKQDQLFSRRPEWKSFTHKVSDATFLSNVIKEKKLGKLENAILYHAARFYNSINRTQNAKPMSIEESWLTSTRTGQYARPHAHGDWDISGVYYFNTSGEDGNIHFLNPSPGRYGNLWSDENKLQYATYKPLNGKIILFPSWLVHYVEENETSLERNSVSFNIKVNK